MFFYYCCCCYCQYTKFFFIKLYNLYLLRNTLKKFSGVVTVLWTLIPKLDLDSDTELSADDDGDEEEDEREIMFAHILSSVLAQQECGELQTFRLQWKFGWDGSHLNAWLRTAAARKVKERSRKFYARL